MDRRRKGSVLFRVILFLLLLIAIFWLAPRFFNLSQIENPFSDFAFWRDAEEIPVTSESNEASESVASTTNQESEDDSTVEASTSALDWETSVTEEETIEESSSEENTTVTSEIEEMKSLEEVARDVLSGFYGNGDERVKRLEEEGYDPQVVQREVDRLWQLDHPTTIAQTAPVQTSRGNNPSPTTKATTVAPTTSPTTTVLVSPDGRSGSQLDQPYRVNGIILVNKKHWVNRNYRPLPDSMQNRGLVQEAWDAFVRMRNDAAAEGVTIAHISSYRTYELQERLFREYSYYHGEAEANRFSARAGQSEHQTGLAIDITQGGPLVEEFADMPGGKWLWENAYKYGFILRYPRGKEHITGYKFEPWHYRYIGVNAAADFGPNHTMTLEEYLGDY